MAIKSDDQIVIEESLEIFPPIPFEEFSIGNSSTRLIKMVVDAGVSFTITYQAQVESQKREISKKQLLSSIEIANLDHEVLPFLNPSRHCESDKLVEFATKTFGNLPNDYFKVLAIEDWIYSNISYVVGSTNSSVSALDTLSQKIGVCKDFAHLGIALCRALDIPARYYTAYASYLNPPDFHACFEAYINGHWVVFDATKLGDLNGLVKISNGKDASESALASYFGDIYCSHMDVQCHPISADFIPFDWNFRREEVLI